MSAKFLIKASNEEDKLVLTEKKTWLEIISKNKKLPLSEQRYFIKDTILDRETLDTIFIEVDRESYLKWHRDDMRQSRNRQAGQRYSLISLDAPVGMDEGNKSAEDYLTMGEPVEQRVMQQIGLDALRDKLRKWKPWAETIFNLILEGEEKCCTQVLVDTYGVSPQTARKYKRQFLEFVADSDDILK